VPEDEERGAFMINLVKALHILAVIAWMSGLMYLPRLFVYHTQAELGSESDKTFQTMERRLLYGIMAPAEIAVVVLGSTLVWMEGWRLISQPWMILKLIFVAFLIGYQHFLSRARKRLAAGHRDHGHRFWRFMNEAPFVAAIVIVIAVTTKLSF
jgi:putative membrane protein